MIDVRIPLAEFDLVMSPGVLPWLQQQGLRTIDLYPAASGPEVELTFGGDLPYLPDLERQLRGVAVAGMPTRLAHLTLLAIRHREDAEPRWGPLRLRLDKINAVHAEVAVFDRGANAGRLVLDAQTWEGWVR